MTNNPEKQQKFDNMYLKNNENLQNVCLALSTIPAEEFLTVGLIKLFDTMTDEEIIKKVKFICEDLRP